MTRQSCSARGALLRTTAVSVLMSTALSGAAFAQDGMYAFNIPAEPLSLALQDVAKASGKQIVFADRLTTGKSTSGLHGAYTVDVAMNQLLTGTDLIVSQTTSGGLVVKSKNVQAAPDNVRVAANDQASDAGAAPVETVVVTGSRVISDVANSPTPIVAVSTAELLQTTPVDLPTALNKLPVFAGSKTPGDPANSSNGIVGNVLNLRDFGAQRTLVLLDGHRQTPANSDGTVDIDTLPQTLFSRTDIVTGGASAVYGSDAVTGVVNFILNKNFTGLKLDANAGISNWGDGAMQQVSMTAGSDLFGGRGHWEGSARYFKQDGILLNARPWGPSAWTGTGAGTAAQPIQDTFGGRFNNFAFGGLVVACGGCAATNMQFGQNGVLTPFIPGAPTNSSNITSGEGDGTYNQASNLLASTVNYQLFQRFSYNIDDTTTFYIQGIAAQGRDTAYHVSSYVQSAAYPKSAFVNNPFLSPTAQAQLANPTGMFTDQQFFLFPYYQAYFANNINTNLNVQVGLDGTLFGKYNWDLFYSHGSDRFKNNYPTDQSNAKLAAAMDAVVNPANNQIVCEVSLTQYASRFPGCVPMNRFGPTAATTAMMNYMFTDSYWIDEQALDDFSGSVSGTVFDLPAGPVKAALDGEYRTQSFGVAANTSAGFVDCTGLRLCVPNMPQTMHGITLPAPTMSLSVYEFAGELGVPLLKDMPLVQSLDLNLAGRYTNYSISGSVETWKIGIDYHVNDSIHLRGTTSIDIRAPTLQDLYAPPNLGHTGFSDPHTGNQNQQVVTLSQGNPNLLPEVARTYTAGIVLSPSFISGLQISVDYYQIKLQNAITNLSGITQGVATVCDASNGTSPLCSLFIRPLPFSDHSAANYPTEVLSEVINSSKAGTSGVDVEVDYAFTLDDVWSGAPGSMNLRSFASYQPSNNFSSFPGAPVVVNVIPKGRFTNFVTYNLNSWTFDLDDRFYVKYPRSNQPGAFFYAIPYGKARNYIDLTISKKFQADGNPFEGYLSIQNLLNSYPPIEPQSNAFPGSSAYGSNGGGDAASGVDDVGRYFTIGVRVEL